ncbi:complex I NDUFA9 subunit family protein [Rhodoferax sp.]|uniref:complex I NDUFA9 subunit family protein n=1 Tax=Rhodoferax sp. TaxID=50421 RepID=UPI00276FC5A0|nr:complex I NDUFA9 subunit family protein [Rhodoferax sp.]
MKRVLILGGTGFVGRHLCEKLTREGWRVTVPTRRAANASHIQMLPGLQVAVGDVHDPATLTRMVVGHDAVVNLIAVLHGTEASFGRTHVELVQSLARACAASGVNRLVHISALGVDDRQSDAAPSMYLRSKARGEAALKAAAQASGLALTVLRPSVIFGDGDKFLTLFARLQGLLPVLPLACAQARFQPVWVEDVAQAVLRCLQTPATIGQTYNLVGPEILTLQQLVQLAARAGGVNHGRGRPVLPLPAGLGRLQAWLMEWLPGAPLMSRDNLDSMKIDNIAHDGLPGLQALGLTPTSVGTVAPTYLGHIDHHGTLQRLRQSAGR